MTHIEKKVNTLDTICHFWVYYGIMIFPLEELIEYDKNMYEITVAASRRSYQLSMLFDKELKEEYEGKMVALAARQVFTQEVEFRLEAE